MKSDCFNNWITTSAFTTFIQKQCKKDPHFIGRVATIRPLSSVSVIAHSPDIRQAQDVSKSKPVGIEIKKLKTRKKKPQVQQSTRPDYSSDSSLGNSDEETDEEILDDGSQVWARIERAHVMEDEPVAFRKMSFPKPPAYAKKTESFSSIPTVGIYQHSEKKSTNSNSALLLNVNSHNNTHNSLLNMLLSANMNDPMVSDNDFETIRKDYQSLDGWQMMVSERNLVRCYVAKNSSDDQMKRLKRVGLVTANARTMAEIICDPEYALRLDQSLVEQPKQIEFVAEQPPLNYDPNSSTKNFHAVSVQHTVHKFGWPIKDRSFITCSSVVYDDLTDELDTLGTPTFDTMTISPMTPSPRESSFGSPRDNNAKSNNSVTPPTTPHSGRSNNSGIGKVTGRYIIFTKTLYSHWKVNDDKNIKGTKVESWVIEELDTNMSRYTHTLILDPNGWFPNRNWQSFVKKYVDDMHENLVKCVNEREKNTSSNSARSLKGGASPLWETLSFYTAQKVRTGTEQVTSRVKSIVSNLQTLRDNEFNPDAVYTKQLSMTPPSSPPSSPPATRSHSHLNW
jgi:hypothetical protein